MGNPLSRLFQRFFEKRESRLVMVGLDGAGKSTLLYKLKLGEVTQTIPTIGFNCETVEFKNQKSMIWDIGGQDTLRPMWKHYYQNAEGVIFVIDSSDKRRMDKVKIEISKILANEDLNGIPILFLANKQDLSVMTPQEIISSLELERIKDRGWLCQGCSALSGMGILEGFNWLFTKIESMPKK